MSNGARTTARITRAATPSAEEVNVWSQWNSYNKLGQLKETLFGSLSGGTISTPLLQDSWSLDALGNWNDLPNAGVNPVGRLTTDYRPGTPVVRQIADATDARNRIDARTDTSVGSQEIAYTYDSAGNLRSDGAFFYQYDAWNRLVQVNEAIPNQGFTGPGPGADENPVAAQERWWPGRMLKHYKYDGLGRLVETQSPYPDVETALGRLRTERFYYDGVRRIQEVVTDPLLMLGLAAESGNPELQQAVANAAPFGEVAADPQTATLESEEVQMMGGESLPAAVTTLHREYVWGPGDAWGWGVDELLAQYDQGRRASWPLQDAGGDVIALCDLGGTSGTARVITQIVHDAYGRVIGRDDPATPATGPPELRVGHKGLFFDR
ncbi:MAG: hypothetical protein KF864_04595 [Phycisphaeraceae bacterium]|nr:hypothetical protein [Phycisphaeraceae bacterium]